MISNIIVGESEGRWRRGECITPVCCFTVWEYDKSGRLKDILLGISSNSGVRQNLEEGFPLHEDRLQGLKRERFVARRVKLLIQQIALRLESATRAGIETQGYSAAVSASH
ncbi:Hypothetical predicted protein, partial [Marmota monax]